uniref:Uncharacterized protein n=1 Tax=Glossina austeni TaxID=7395 RepID=A0A1A9VE50_GLOAU
METFVNITTSTAIKLTDVGMETFDERIETMMLSNLSKLYQPKIMSIESSEANITDDYVERKLLQETQALKSQLISLVGKKQGSEDTRPQCCDCQEYDHIITNFPKNKKKYLSREYDNASAIASASMLKSSTTKLNGRYNSTIKFKDCCSNLCLRAFNSSESVGMNWNLYLFSVLYFLVHGSYQKCVANNYLIQLSRYKGTIGAIDSTHVATIPPETNGREASASLY